MAATTTVLPPSTTPADSDVAGKIVGLDYDDDHVLFSPALRFAVTSRPFGIGTSQQDTDDSRRLIAAVDAALALRGRGGDVDELEINFVYGAPWNRYHDAPPSGSGQYVCRHGHAGDITSEHVASWLRFAKRRVTGRFTLAVPVLPRQAATTNAAVVPERKLAAELPTSARAEAMSLTLGNASLTVPAAAFNALVDLALTHVRIEPGSADERNLGHLLSAACCPRLRRLRLEYIAGLAALRLAGAAATLEEVRLDHVRDMATLEIDAPGLRALRITGCYEMVSDDAAARISAPRLEKLAFAETCRPERLRFVDGAASVRRLEEVCLWSHSYSQAPGEDWNGGSVWLLQNCTAVDSLDVHLALQYHPPEGEDIGDELIDLVPQLPNIVNLTIDAGCRHLEPSAAKLIAKCSQVECLSIEICFPCKSCARPNCFTNWEDGWNAEKISLKRLREVTITNFLPIDHHLSLVRLMVASAPKLERMTAKLHPSAREQNYIMPCDDRGHWAPCVSTYSSGGHRVKVLEWTSEKKRGGDQDSDSIIFSKF